MSLRKNNSRFYIAFAACFVSFGLFGQDLEKDMVEITEAMRTASSVSIDVDINMYSRKGGSVIYKGNASLTKTDASSKTVLAEMEFITTPSYELRVDHEEEAVLIFKKEKPSASNLPKSEKVDFDVDALRKLIEAEEANSKKPTIKLLSSNGGVKKYSITNGTGIKEIILELNTSSKKLLSVIIEYQGESGSAGGQYLVLKYTQFDYNKDVSSVFDLTKYFTVKDNTYVLSPQLKGYHLFTEL